MKLNMLFQLKCMNFDAKLLHFFHTRKHFYILYIIKVRQSTNMYTDFQSFSSFSQTKKVRQMYPFCQLNFAKIPLSSPSRFIG